MKEEKAEHNFQKHLRRYFPTSIDSIKVIMPYRKICLLFGTNIPYNKLLMRM